MHMRISWFDAIDLFSMGGYLDKTTGKYIPSRDYLEKRRRIFQNMEIPDYDKIELGPEQYIAAPHINTFNVNAKCAMDLGLTKDELLKMGCSSEMYKCEMLSAEKRRVFWRRDTVLRKGKP